MALTSTLGWECAPANALLSAKQTALPRDSVANVSQIVAVDRNILTDRVGHLYDSDIGLILAGIDVVLGRS